MWWRYFCKNPLLSIDIGSRVMDCCTYVFIPTMKIGRFSRNLTSRRFKAILPYLTMCGFKILSLAVTKVLWVAKLITCLPALPLHRLDPICRGLTAGKSWSKRNYNDHSKRSVGFYENNWCHFQEVWWGLGIYIYKDWFGEGYALGLMVGCSKRRWVSGGRDVRLLLCGAAAVRWMFQIVREPTYDWRLPLEGKFRLYLAVFAEEER